MSKSHLEQPISAQAVRLGALNLLTNCIGVKSGDRVLVVREPPIQRHYDEVAPDAVETEARALGAKVTTMTAEVITHPKDFPKDVIHVMQDMDHAVFLNRIGDYVRFIPLPGTSSKTVCYALDQGMLGSPYAGLPHQLMAELHHKLELELEHAHGWRITCPLGTNISGSFCWPSRAGAIDDDFTVTLFPVSTFKPVPCDTATGTVAISRWVAPGGANKLGLGITRFEGVVLVEVERGMVTEFHGDGGADTVRKHYDYVSSELEINRDRVHSWHAGINPQTAFPAPAADDPERWGGISFGSPKYLHFHTCGDVPPGEITWSLFDPSVWVDNEEFWRDGDFVWLQREDNRKLIAQHPGADCLLQPSRSIGT